MISGKKVTGVVPARSGSKGLPNKNIKKLVDKPLIGWTIQEGSRSKYIDEIIVSSDSLKILKIGSKYGKVTLHQRSKKLSHDKSKIIDVLLNIFKEDNITEYIILLQPTSPSRNYKDIDMCLKKMIKGKFLSAASVITYNKNIEWFFKIRKNKIFPLKKIFPKNTNRQVKSEYYQFSGDFYIVQKKWMFKNKKLVSKETMPFLLRNNLSVDIDSEFDFKKAEKHLININKKL